MKNIQKIQFPNTCCGYETSSYTVGKNCNEIRQILKSGEMAGVNWFQIIKDNKIIAEIKESVCNVYGEDENKLIKEL